MANDWWHQHLSESANGERWTVTFESPRAERCLPPWYSDREWPNGDNPFKEKQMIDHERPDQLFDPKSTLQRVDRTTHTHHCWHSSDVSAFAAADGFVSQKCCECPETRIAHRSAIGVWDQA